MTIPKVQAGPVNFEIPVEQPTGCMSLNFSKNSEIEIYIRYFSVLRYYLNSWEWKSSSFTSGYSDYI